MEKKDLEGSKKPFKTFLSKIFLTRHSPHNYLPAPLANTALNIKTDQNSPPGWVSPLF